MTTPVQDHEARFVESLEKLVSSENRGALAALRRGLGKRPGTAPEMHRLIVPYLRSNSRPDEDARFYLLASLFASWHQGSSGGEQRVSDHLGESLAVLKKKEESSSESLEKRFEALLNCHADDLPTHLRHMIALLRGKGVPVGWLQLLRDLRFWDHPDRLVQRRWARAFWADLGRSEVPETQEPESDETAATT